ncbi:efflux RND transporter periplasmic adaptor subunit [Iodidimonas sp. SYSU 1G8]|uniref:efflux RND transporter periplasmic adaptor subunit n=1 Tax=Iodidimonas sp. SYSU 1G8 TaxID=3133967 RepID=UPI0031FEB74C
MLQTTDPDQSRSNARNPQASSTSGPRAWKPVAVTAVVLVLLLAGIFGWRMIRTAPSAPPAAPPLPVSAMQVMPRAMPATLEAIGTLEAVRQLMVSPEVAGRVVAIHFEAGDTVRAGQPLIQLYDAPEQADRAAAQADAALARNQFSRAEALAPGGAVSKSLLDQRRAERDRAEAAIRQLDARIAQKTIRAPFAGEIGLRRVNLGQYLSPGETVVTLTSLGELHANFTVPQQSLGLLRPGADVTVLSDAWPGRSFTAKVSAVEPRISDNTRNVTVQAVLPNADGALRPGMYVKVAVALPPEPDRLVVPATAIMTSAMGDSVVVVRDIDARKVGTATVASVTAGRRVGDDVVIDAGLQPGDTVVTTGQIRIMPGQKVRLSGAPGEG